jgi:phosphoesterase RecJ-like protein
LSEQARTQADGVQAEVIESLQANESFWITSHHHPDPDAVGSMLALAHFLIERGKRVEVVCQDPAPRITNYLPGIEMIRSEPASQRMDVLVVLDVSVLDRIGSKLVRRLSNVKTVVNIDHHATGKPFADVGHIVPTACATCEVLFNLFEAADGSLTRETAECLYAGISGDTGNFRFSNTSPRAHEIAAELISCGVRPQDSYEHLYGSRTYGQTRLLGMVLDTLQTTHGGQIATIRVTQEMYRETGTTTEDVDGFSDYPRSVDGVKVIAFLGELPGGRIKVSFRSRVDGLRIDGIAASFGGGGHAYAAGCLLDPPLEVAERRVLRELRRLVPGVVAGVAASAAGSASGGAAVGKGSDGRHSESEQAAQD